MRLRITIVLMVAIGGLTAIAVGTVLFVTATASVRNTLELMGVQARLTIAAVERGVEDHVRPARNVIAGIRRRVAEGSLDIDDHDSLVATLSGALAPAPQLGGVVVWRPDGQSVWVVRHADGSIRVEHERATDVEEFKAFLADVSDNDEIRWGEPYHREGATYVTVSGALVRDGAVVGVVGTGVSLVELSRFVRSELTEAETTAFVLYGEDKALAHPAMLADGFAARLTEEEPLPDLAELGDPVLAQFPRLPRANLPRNDDFDVRETDERGRGHVILSRMTDAYGAVPWNIGLHVPVAAVDEQLRRLAGSIGIGLGLLVLSVAAAIVLARRVARPIRAVSAAAERIERLELDQIRPLPGSRIRELDEQARSFNSMVQGLRWFQTYVPQKLVKRLMAAADGPATDARAAELTVMFTDITGFTHLSETMPPADVAEMLNRHFALLNACIEAEDGTLDKFIGDATMAFWGAPEPILDHAARACRAALAIAAAMEADSARGDGEPLRVKIALHSGPLIVGNIGAPSRMNYTVIGDTVNVCSRIESIAGDYSDERLVTILVSGDLVAAAGEGFVFEPIGARVVKGRARAVDIWRLTGARPA